MGNLTSSWNWGSFSEDEMRCQGSGILIVSNRFMNRLQSLRDKLSRPMRITSACRSSEHNVAIGGHPRSLHVCDSPFHQGQDGCLAVDVAVLDGKYRGNLVSLAWSLGWSVGWNRSFVHLDRRDLVGLQQNSFDY